MKDLTYTSMIVDINDQNFEKLMKIGEILDLPRIIIDDGEVLSIDETPVEEFCTLHMLNESESEYLDLMVGPKESNYSVKAAAVKEEPREMAECNGASKSSGQERPIGKLPAFTQFANVNDEPENINKDFLKAQLSVKHQSIIRNVLALVSSIAVAITFLLEKLGII